MTGPLLFLGALALLFLLAWRLPALPDPRVQRWADAMALLRRAMANLEPATALAAQKMAELRRMLEEEPAPPDPLEELMRQLRTLRMDHREPAHVVVAVDVADDLRRRDDLAHNWVDLEHNQRTLLGVPLIVSRAVEPGTVLLVAAPQPRPVSIVDALGLNDLGLVPRWQDQALRHLRGMRCADGCGAYCTGDVCECQPTCPGVIRVEGGL